MTPYILYSEILHLFLKPPSRSWYLSEEVVDWMDENDIKVTEREFMTASIGGSGGGGGSEHGMLFKNDIDLMAFKLRWS